MTACESVLSGVCVAATFLGCSLDAVAQDGSGQDAAAQAQVFREFFESQTIHVNGHDQPQLIPERVRVRGFADNIGVTDAAASIGLDAADAAGVEDFAAETQRATDEEAEAFAALMARHCEEISGKSVDEIDGVRFAASVVEFQQRIDAELVARFRNMMDSVSPTGRRRIDAYIASKIVDAMGWGETNTLAIASRFPEWAAMNSMRVCGMLDGGLQMPVIVSSSRSGVQGSSGRLDQVLSIGSARAAPRDEAAGARITFTRIVAPSELRELLSGRNLELRGLDYRELGPFAGHFSFRPGVDATTAIDAAQEQILYRKLAEAYGAARGVASVYVPAIGPMGAAQPLDFAGGRFDSEQALRPTREELDALPLSPCIADDRIEQHFDVSGPDRAMVEAACGLRPYAITLLGDSGAIEAFVSELGDTVASVASDPPLN